MAAKDGGPLTEFDRLTLHQAVTVVALELLRRRVADDTERRLAGDVLTRDGLRRARRRRAGPPAASRSGCATARRSSCSRRRAPLKAATEDALARALRDEAPAGLAAGTGRFSCALVAPPRGGGDEELFALAERLRARVSREVGDRARRRRRPDRRGRRAAPRLPRGALRARGAGAGRQQRRRRRPRHLPRPRLVPAAALAAGRRGAAAVLRLDPRARSRRARAPTAAS